MTPTMSPSEPATEPRPWGAWTSVALCIFIFEVAGRAYDFVLNASGLQPVLDRVYALHALNIVVSWGIDLLIVVLAVRLTAIPLCDYLGWVRPRIADVVLAIAIPVMLYGAFCVFLIYAGAAAPAAEGYRAAIAAGTSPLWFVLQAWPTLILSPFVEETIFRGFLWRGVEFRFGKGAAFVVTTVLFAAIHYSYWMPDGVVSVGAVVQYLVSSAVFGALRWRSGGTIAPMIAHALDNGALRICQMVLAAIVP